MKTSATINEILDYRQKDLQKEMLSVPLRAIMDDLESNMQILNSSKLDNKKSNGIFKSSIMCEDDVAVICEFKPSSPSKGHISDTMIEDVIDVFNDAGASAVSVLTENRYFNGSLKDLQTANKLTELPIIRKDFILNEYQIYQAKMAGASAVLLMNNVYPDIGQAISLCNELELEYIVECRNKDDIQNSLDCGAEIIGINNRNFSDFSIDLKTTQKLARYVPEEIVLVSESGVKGPEDAKQLASYGVDAILVGTAIMGVNNKNDMLKAAENIINSVKGSRIDRT
jgi:indole-3-glycerol phosphate synthase